MTEHTKLPATTDVLIVGAGAAGLTLAAALTAAGTDAVLVDKQAEGANTSRACVVHARTLEVLENLKVTGDLVSRGLIVPRFTVRDGDRVLMTVEFGGLPSAYPFTLMVPQNVTEAVLLARLQALGGRVCRPYEVASVTQDGDGVTATMTTGETIRAAYLAGTDGMHSMVRERVGTGFTGDSYPQSFVLADVHMDWPLPREEVMLYYHPEGLVVVAPLPGDRRYRIVATVPEAPEHPDRDFVQALLDARGPRREPARVDGIVWSSRFHVHHRLADRYHAGRLVLAGDAAHVHSPAGGQGMNTGIQDAMALAGRLAAIVGDSADPGRELAAYEAERRPVAERVVTMTDRMTRIATTGSVPLQKTRNALMRALDWLPAAERAMAMNLSELVYDPQRQRK
jgi:2-polyprenyl-6-methoxyphenol hydroxylase-like FAD-dependent oxidoreductase